MPPQLPRKVRGGFVLADLSRPQCRAHTDFGEKVARTMNQPSQFAFESFVEEGVEFCGLGLQALQRVPLRLQRVKGHHGVLVVLGVSARVTGVSPSSRIALMRGSVPTNRLNTSAAKTRLIMPWHAAIILR